MKMNVEYIKDYKYKELKQYVLAYLLIAVASVGFYVKDTIGAVGLLSALSSMIAIDTLAGAICALVFILNEFWPDKVKQQIIYKDMPSDTVFTDIASGKIDAAGFDLAKAKEMFAHLSNAPANQQTAEWNDLLRKCKDAERGNVIDAERMQLMTRDICMSTISLLVMTLIAFGVLAVAYMSLVTAIKILYIPLVYLVIMWFVTKKAAKSRANRIVVLVIKNAVQGLKAQLSIDSIKATEEKTADLLFFPLWSCFIISAQSAPTEGYAFRQWLGCRGNGRTASSGILLFPVPLAGSL